MQSVFAIFLAILAILPQGLWACPHTPIGHKAVVIESTKKALLYHDGVNAHLVVQTQFESKAKLPKSLAWVIPLPSLPVSYKEEGAYFFPNLEQWFKEENVTWRMPIPLPPGAEAGAYPYKKAHAPKIKVHKVVQAGGYQITPIEVLSEEGGAELNAWLGKNGFNAVAVEHQVYYLKKGAVFLALKMKGVQGQSLRVKPLHIVYPGPLASLPLKFSSGSGVFNVFLYTLTKQDPLSMVGSLPGMQLLAYDDLARTKEKAALGPLFKALGTEQGFLAQYSGGPYNTPENKVQNLPHDPHLEKAP